MGNGWKATGRLAPLYEKVGGVDRLAELSGIGRTTISAYNTGTRNLGWRNAKRLAEAAGVNPVDLGAPVDSANPRAVTLAELADLMHAGRSAQERQWGDIRGLVGEVSALGEDVRGIATDLAGLVTDLASLAEFLRSALEPPNSERERRLGGS